MLILHLAAAAYLLSWPLFLSLTGLGSWWEEAWLGAAHAQGLPFWKSEVAAVYAT